MLRASQSCWFRAMAAAVAAAIAAASSEPAAAVSLQQEVAAQVRECANVERAKRGLPLLVENRVLDKAAMFHARNMARYDFSEHYDPWGHGPWERVDRFGSADAFRKIGENLSAGETSAAEACSDWMRSPGHRAAILEPEYRTIGGGFAEGQTVLRYYYVQEFGAENPAGPKARVAPRDRWPRVAMRLSRAGDQLTLRVDGRPQAVARRGEALDVPLGRVRPRARITVEARSVSGDLSWNIEQRRDGRRVYSDAHSGAAARATVVDLAVDGEPLVHRVTLDPSGHVLESFTSRVPSASPWRRVGLLGRFR
jgi:uncharacterized protein YkwD